MRDRDYLRKTVAGALEKALEISDAVTILQTVCENAETSQIEVERHDGTESEHVTKMAASLENLKMIGPARKELGRQTIHGYAHTVRLRALLGENHVVVTTYLAAVESYRLLGQAVDFGGSPRSADEKEKEAVAQNRVGPSLQAFEDACRREFTA